MTQDLAVVEPKCIDVSAQAAPANPVQFTESGSALLRALYAFTFFVSAFLLFQIQLIICKYALPWFGGTPAVFTACMLFFQVLLLLGYAYAQITSKRTAGVQVVLHISLLTVVVVLVLVRLYTWRSPLLPDASWKPLAGGHPLLQILSLLFASVAFPYFALSATGPLLQAWFGSRYGRVPYRWYALSNAGSLLGLLTYPFVVEPTLSLRAQANVWFGLFAMFAAACAAVAIAFMAGQSKTEFRQTVVSPKALDVAPTVRRRFLWLLLPACGSLMLLATTNQMCQDIAVVPLLWVLPLSLYLLSFILCFDSERWYSRTLWSVALGLGTTLAVLALYNPVLPLLLQIAIYSFVLFAACMVCHGELARLKPSTAHLTTFYVIMAAGGALGGILVSVVAPLVFKGFWEFHLGLWLCCVGLCGILLSDFESWIYHPQPWLLAFCALILFSGPVTLTLKDKPMLLACFGVGTIAFVLFIVTGQQTAPQGVRVKAARFSAATTAIALGAILSAQAVGAIRGAVTASRNFYGVLAVSEVASDNPDLHALRLRHGKILHGLQYVSPAKRRIPTTYFAEYSGIGLAIGNHPARIAGQNIRIGVVGLGVGTIAAYGRKGDYLRFYEINPDVVKVATGSPQGLFTYVGDSQARIDIILGDARISLERELAQHAPQRFDVLAVDAFSGDAVPLHLLTAEAFDIYLQHLRGPESVLAFHISNRALDLSPAIARVAEHFGRTAWLVDTTGEQGRSVWVLVTKTRTLPPGKAAVILLPNPNFALWTDDYSNVLAVLKRR